MEYIAIIPARGGSKGIKDKNLQLVGGRSLLARAITSAQKIDGISRVIVSTDSNSIIEEAIVYNAEIHRRRDFTSSDSAKTIDVIQDIYRDMELSDEICILLQTTSPLRQVSDIQACINEYEGNSSVKSVVSVTLCEHHPYKIIIQDNEGQMVPIRQMSDLEAPRQELPKALRVNGAVYISSFKDLIEYNSFFSHPTRFFEMGEDESIDIDNSRDLERANLITEGKLL